jgi:hypothetical protein
MEGIRFFFEHNAYIAFCNIHLEKLWSSTRLSTKVSDWLCLSVCLSASSQLVQWQPFFTQGCKQISVSTIHIYFAIWEKFSTRDLHNVIEHLWVSWKSIRGRPYVHLFVHKLNYIYIRVYRGYDILKVHNCLVQSVPFLFQTSCFWWAWHQQCVSSQNWKSCSRGKLRSATGPSSQISILYDS